MCSYVKYSIKAKGILTYFRIAPSQLWKPDVALYNKQDLSKGILAADPKSSNTNAQLFSNGNILWPVPVSHKVMKEQFQPETL